MQNKTNLQAWVMSDLEQVSEDELLEEELEALSGGSSSPPPPPPSVGAFERSPSPLKRPSGMMPPSGLWRPGY